MSICPISQDPLCLVLSIVNNHKSHRALGSRWIALYHDWCVIGVITLPSSPLCLSLPSGSPGSQSLYVWLSQWNMLHPALPASGPGQDPPADPSQQHAAWVSSLQLAQSTPLQHSPHFHIVIRWGYVCSKFSGSRLQSCPRPWDQLALHYSIDLLHWLSNILDLNIESPKSHKTHAGSTWPVC